MLTEKQIQDNRIEFLKLISQIEIPGADIEGLVKFLDENDFFSAPASTMYHSHFEGGLCLHSLNVYKNLVKLNDMFNSGYEKDSLLVVGLLHDLAKVNFYEAFMANKKIYHDAGSKHDNGGKFDWVSVPGFRTRDVKDRVVGGTHGFNSMMIINKYIPLTYEESIAVYNHHAGMDDKNATYDLSAIMERYKLVTLLHSADLLATYMLETAEEE